MSLRSVYERFLASPDSLRLSENASLYYIPTLRTFTPSGAIIRHLESQTKSEVRKKAEKVIGSVEGQSSISLDVETTLEFISSGGVYLPGLENFVTDRIVTLPTIHIINFDDESKIQRIRIYWDQACLLRQVDVIGSRGKNWPIADGKAQARLITSALAGTTIDSPPTRGRGIENGAADSRSISPSKKRIQDPHASLALFAEQDTEEDGRRSRPAIIPQRASAKPADHQYSELFAAGNEDNEACPESSLASRKAYSASVAAQKGASASRYQQSRLFDEGTTEDLPARYKSNPAKYNHFDLGEAAENDHFQHVQPATDSNARMRAKTNKHLSQWDFEDFVTPEKVPHRVRGQDVRHFGWGDDEEFETSGKHQRAVQPRRDAEAHFDLKDGGIPDADQQRPMGRPKGNAHSTALGLYENNLYDDMINDTKSGKEKQPLSAVTTNVGRAKDLDPKDGGIPDAGQQRPMGRPKGNAHSTALGLYENNLYDDMINDTKSGKGKQPLSAVTTNVGRAKDLDPHWAMSDPSPAPGERVNNENRPLAGDRKKAVQMTDASWEPCDQPPAQNKRGAGPKPLRKGLESHWGFGDDENMQTTSGKKTEKSYWDF